MGEILGISNLSGNLVSFQTKHLVPYALAHKLFRLLITEIPSKSLDQKIDNFRVQYIVINDTILFVFSTLTENPFLSLDSLNKLKDFLLLINRDLKMSLLLKKSMEINYALEDILHGMDPTARITKGNLFTISRPLQSFYSSATNLLYMNKA